MAAANDLLAAPREVDLSVSQRLGLHVIARLAQRHDIEVSLTPTPGCGVTAAVVLPPPLFADPDAGPEDGFAEGFADEVEDQGEVVPAALAASVAAPAADLPAPVAAGPPGWTPAEQWIDLTDEPAGNGHTPASGPGNGNGAEWPADEGADWSGWWEPSPGDLDGAEPISPIAARPPLSERVQAAAPRASMPAAPAPMPPAAPAPAAPALGAARHPLPAAPDEAAPEGLLLSRRVPQAHLAPELRRQGQASATAGQEGPLPDAAGTRAALSRYQASRQAARAAVDEGGGVPDGRADEPGPDPPPSAGGWS
jgi:hypothetical protein